CAEEPSNEVTRRKGPEGLPGEQYPKNEGEDQDQRGSFGCTPAASIWRRGLPLPLPLHSAKTTHGIVDALPSERVEVFEKAAKRVRELGWRTGFKTILKDAKTNLYDLHREMVVLKVDLKQPENRLRPRDQGDPKLTLLNFDRHT